MKLERMKTRTAAAILAGALAAGCQLSLDLDHTFDADGGDDPGGGQLTSPGAGPAQGGAVGVLDTSGAGGALANGGGYPGSGGAAGSPSESGEPAATDGTFGNGGAAGTAGSASSAGASGTGPSNGGTGGTVAAPPTPATCSGCLELIVPVSTTGDKAVFEFALDGDHADLSDAVITWRIQAVNDTEQDWSDSRFMVIKAYAQSPPATNPPGFFTDALFLSLDNFQPNTWLDLVIDLASLPAFQGGPNEFDKSDAQRIGLELAAGSGFFGTHTIRIFVDAVTFEGVTELSNRTFDSSAEGFALNTFDVPMNTRIETHFE